MLERVNLFCTHCVVHLFGYTIPRILFTLLVRLPVTLWELVTFKRPFTYSFQREREIKVVSTSKDAHAREALLRQCGLNKTCTYADPMYNGHIHTVLGALRPAHRVAYTRELIEGEDTNPICLDWLRVPKERLEKLKGVVLVVPGVGNYGQTPYIQQLARLVVKHNYHCCVLTPRGMGSAPLTVPRMTCLTFTADVRATLRQKFTKPAMKAAIGRDVPLFVVGYSGGGTTLMKTLVEETTDKDVAALYPGGFPVQLCVSMSAPYDMVAHSKIMQTRVGLLLYQKAMMTALNKYSRKHWAVLKNGIPGIAGLSGEEMLEKMRLLKTVQDFDEHVVAPHFGYGHAIDYYNDAYGPKWVRQMDKSVAVVCVAARDDPLVSYGVTADDWQQIVDDKSNVLYVETPVGGHLAHLLGPVDEARERPSFLVRFPVTVFDSFVAEAERGKKKGQ